MVGRCLHQSAGDIWFLAASYAIDPSVPGISISTFLSKHVGLSMQSIHGHRSLAFMLITGLANAIHLFTTRLWLAQ